ncbi:MAG: iron-sulfur cluster insertion protein ErpA [Magnetococcales bacterium]|nr:iron-sulfur cluster insertion protein ErpA [Magnetococcales bacterium]MBF0114357.1 iron-sulfur cluster insertion protein ErpA [Magnetococcales bacterium]
MSVTLTASAAKKLGTLLQEENNPDLKLRIFVSGGGCSGFKYGFTFDDQQDAEDAVIEQHGIQVLVDATSINYLRGIEVDYVEDLNGSQFVIKNPNAASSCGCGQSFTPTEGGGCANA